MTILLTMLEWEQDSKSALHRRSIGGFNDGAELFDLLMEKIHDELKVNVQDHYFYNAINCITEKFLSFITKIA